MTILPDHGVAPATGGRLVKSHWFEMSLQHHIDYLASQQRPLEQNEYSLFLKGQQHGLEKAQQSWQYACDHLRFLASSAVLEARTTALGIDMNEFVAEQHCHRCGAVNPDGDVRSYTVWVPWGRSCFDLAFYRDNITIWLCEECDTEQYARCEECGDIIPIEYAQLGYLDNDQLDVDDYEYPETVLCPECAEASPDHTLLVRIDHPNW